MRNAENDINKIKFLVKSITNYLDSYEEKISKYSKNKLDKEEMMLFYYLSLVLLIKFNRNINGQNNILNINFNVYPIILNGQVSNFINTFLSPF